MPEEHLQAVPDPDEFDRELRDLTSGRAEPARFREPSAAERAKLAPLPGRAPRPGWRRVPIARRPRPRAAGGNRQASRRAAGAARRAGGATRGRPGTARRQRVRSIARAVALLVAFAALLYALHLLGFGPR